MMCLQVFDARVPGRNSRQDVPCCARDEGKPLKTGLQKQVLNHLMLLGLRVRVVSDKEKAGSNLSGVNQKGERK